jgi:hypothetical protein
MRELSLILTTNFLLSLAQLIFVRSFWAHLLVPVNIFVMFAVKVI